MSVVGLLELVVLLAVWFLVGRVVCCKGVLVILGEGLNGDADGGCVVGNGKR